MKPIITSQALLDYVLEMYAAALEVEQDDEIYNEYIQAEPEPEAIKESDILDAIAECIQFRMAEVIKEPKCPICGKEHTKKEKPFYCDSCGKLLRYG